MRLYIILFLSSCALAFTALSADREPPPEHDWAMEQRLNLELTP
jgi:hypothetical protein